MGYEMTEEDKKRIKEVLWDWAKKHPNGDKVVLHLAQGHEFTPLDIASHVEKESEFGMLQLKVIERAIDRFGLEPVIRGFEGKLES